MDVARWMRPAIEYAHDVLSGGYEFMLSFSENPVLVQPFVLFFATCVLFCCLSYVFCSKIKLDVLGLSFDFLVLCSFVFGLKSSLQKNNLSSSKLVLIHFGYGGFSFPSHAVRLWFVVFSKLRC